MSVKCNAATGFCLLQVFKNVDVENALKQNIEANLTIHTLSDSNWGTSISKADFTNNLRIQLNPPQKLDNIHGVLQFTAYVGGFLRVVPVTSLLQASEQFGNISFTRPTLYIFPGCQGDSALFGVNGFNLLVNGGYNRRACFWDFARHLDRLDAVLLTHLSTDNIFGLSTVLQRKTLENIHPQIGYLYFNAPEKLASLSSGDDGDSSTSKSPSLIVNLVEEANKLTLMAKQLGISPHPCSRSATAATCDPVNLYHKLGHGSLDMYILNPVADSKELKEFYQLWNKQTASLDAGGPFSLPSALSVCALLVWKPYNVDEKIVRIFFPGNAPQHKVIEGFEKMKSYSFLQLASCTTRDLTKPAPIKKPLVGLKASAPGGRSQGKAPASARADSTRGTNGRLESPRKETKPVTSKTEVKASSPTKPSRPIKDDSTKKTTKDREKPKALETAKSKTVAAKEDEKETKVRKDNKVASAPGPHKATSPTKSPSPPKAPSPPKSPTKTKAPAAAAAKIQESKSDAAAAPAEQTESGAPPVDNHVANHGVQPDSEPGQVSHQEQLTPQSAVEIVISEARDAVGDVDDMTVSISSSVDKQKLEDLGIYDGQQSADYVNGQDYEVEEEEKPQALPEPPVMLESPSLETDTMPDYSSKIESEEQELSEFSRAEEELLELENTSETSYDPAQEIPLSPEPSQAEDQDLSYPSSPKPQTGFEVPVFSHDGPDIVVGSSQPAVEHNIQYGIDDSSNGRDMGGIQEVDEEEHEDDAKNDKKALHEMGIYDDEEGNEENGFEKESNPDNEEIKKDIQHQNEEKPSVERSMSAERELENEALQEGFDEGIEDDERVSLPETCDKDSSPEVDPREKHLDEHLAGSEFTASEDKDSLDSEPDDGPASPRINGKHPFDAGLAGDHRPGAGNSFIGIESPGSCAQSQQIGGDSDDEQAATFDPATQWGQPLGLPSPPSGESARAGEGRKTGASRPNGSDKRPAAASTPKPSESRTARHASAPPEGKKRPATAPPAAGKGTSRPGSAPKRPGSGVGKSGPAVVKAPTLPPVTVFYVDLTYIPNHGDSTYSDVEFFKRIRARNYVISSLSPNPQVLDSLLEAKAGWEQKDLEVTIIPTYDNEILRHWMALNKEKLQELRVDLAPAVSRCTVQLQDLETSLPAFRLEV